MIKVGHLSKIMKAKAFIEHGANRTPPLASLDCGLDRVTLSTGLCVPESSSPTLRRFLKENVSLIGSSKPKELDIKWRNLQAEELELYSKRMELITKQSSKAKELFMSYFYLMLIVEVRSFWIKPFRCISFDKHDMKLFLLYGFEEDDIFSYKLDKGGLLMEWPFKITF
ncbi:hypothetical protein LguiA_030786 [Lonicera macranthoides]